MAREDVLWPASSTNFINTCKVFQTNPKYQATQSKWTQTPSYLWGVPWTAEQYSWGEVTDLPGEIILSNYEHNFMQWPTSADLIMCFTIWTAKKWISISYYFIANTADNGSHICLTHSENVNVIWNDDYIYLVTILFYTDNKYKVVIGRIVPDWSV